MSKSRYSFLHRRVPRRDLALGLALLALVPCAALVPTAQAAAQRQRVSGEARRILEAVDRFFTAMRAGDADGVGSVLSADGMLFFERRNADGSYSLHHKGNAQWLAEFRAWNGHMEDIPSRSRVQVWGPIATVSHAFVFHRNGRFSHCGINLIQLVKVGQDWRIANIVWTEEQRGCPQAGEAR